uniref:Uncharacterized protein n=1 Tax=Avena sativa TaxID=4498 RepID=A0ACD5UIU5_AVESA
MGVSSAVQWWEEWQLRVLVLASLVVQYILFITAALRKLPSRSGIRPAFTWLAYLGSDAIAIYGLATLFNRHKEPDGVRDNILEVVWAPILLMHLGGQDAITAYNIEDNELWTRHILTAVSQVTVAVYVFWKSWPGGDQRLLQAAIVLFVPGVLKCFEKPLALHGASINSLVSSSGSIRRTTNKKVKIDPLEDFVRMAKHCFAAESNESVNAETETEIGTQTETEAEAKAEKPAEAVHLEPDRLFVDLASPPSDARVKMMKYFSELDDFKAYCSLRERLHNTFDLLYTKQNMFSYFSDPEKFLTQKLISFRGHCGVWVRTARSYLPFAAIALFHHSHREAYNHYDVKVTYTIICCTAGLEFAATGFLDKANLMIAEQYQLVIKICTAKVNLDIKPYIAEEKQPSSKERAKNISQPRSNPDFLNDMVSQCNVLALFVRDQKYSKTMSIVGKIQCREFLHQHWRMKSCYSSRSITALVLEYVKGGWKDHIQDVPTYKMFNENRGHCALKEGGCYEDLGWILDGAFDESVILWHLATDLCYYYTGPACHGSKCTNVFDAHVCRCPAWCEGSDYHERAVLCREMSNYMMHLLLVNPEMLMAGSRRNLFTVAYDELKDIMNKDKNQRLEERELAHSVISMVNGRASADSEGSDEGNVNGTASADPEGSDEGNEDGTASADPKGSHNGFIRDAWDIAKVLMGLPEEKMWAVIEGVWVEMLCFSASRCRGYLHAKGLGAGIEYLSYVWLLQYYMGMETLAEKLHRADHQYPSPLNFPRGTTSCRSIVPENSSATGEEITIAVQ